MIKKPLKKVDDNTTITVGVKGEEKVLKEGKPLDHNIKHNIEKSNRSVGVSTGATINMGNYESFRVDCWLTDDIQEGETQPQALQRVSDICRQHLNKVISSIES
ncbi:MAG: hypothetical protein R3Y64_11600 [Peptostreptococcaceae bacterium]